MINAAGSITALRDGFTSVGGSNLQSDYYWSSTEYDASKAWYFHSLTGSWDKGREDVGRRVRACLAF